MTGVQLKLAGMKLAATKHKIELARAQRVAFNLAQHAQNSISINEVRHYYMHMGWKWDLGNAAGGIFKGECWEWCGFTNAQHEGGHSRMVRTWRLRR